MTTLDMPRLSGGRRRAEAMVDLLDRQEPNLRDATVQLDCLALVAGTESFALGLLQAIVVERHARLQVINVDEDFAGIVEEAAATLNVSDRVEIDRLTR